MREARLEDLAGLLGDGLPGGGDGVRRTPRIVASGNFATPLELVEAVDAALPEYRICMLNAQPGIPDREGVVHETSFVGPGMRHSARLSYVPSRLSLVPTLFARTLPPDVVLVHTSVPWRGKVSLGVEVNLLPAAIEAAKARGGVVIAQINPRMPYTFGDAELSLDLVDVGVEVDVALRKQGGGDLDDDSRVIGERVSALVPDGATLQLGIGAVPDAVLPGLVRRRGLKIWTEMFSDGVLRLDEAGALDPDAALVASFLFGTPDLYRWVDRNERVRMLRTERTNDPGLIAQRPSMVSINSALQVDLFGQANASRLQARIYSGFGGQTDFLVGALHSPGGQAFLALRSWHPRADVSTVVPLLEEPATSFQPSAIVTERGLAQVWGLDQEAQAREIIDQAAHPRVRDELREEAHFLGLM
ncbi:MAG TPA: acetyl-CoA hydrolase/transferase C-terminal domain-containing protein [Kineosporiaceae bacterium]|nr:acetyl-CoA hydrolase/transferase C-terminal domain-containing protein [Kineosporiaceae bacterium]